MKKILLSLITIGVVSATAVGASRAFFADTEKSEGNTFTAGAIDLQIDYTGYYNKAVDGSPNAGSWSLKDLSGEKFFNFSDIKPGDFGEGTISFHVINNDAWACVTIDGVTSNENSITEPEAVMGDTDAKGELDENLYFTAWLDNENNIWDAGEQFLFTNKYGPMSDVLGNKTYALADSTTGTPISGGQTIFIGMKWCAGAMSIDEELGVIACDGSGMDNKSQTDSVSANITFSVEQSRNNPDFRCTPVQNTELVLENKDQNYNRLTDDGVYGVLTFNPSADTFDYSLKAYGLTATSVYKLIYYADGWPGNHPGALIGTFTTDDDGKIDVSGSKELGMDLPTSPDENLASGAKIWLVPGSVYTDGALSINTWPFAGDWLFETNLITYNDTNN